MVTIEHGYKKIIRTIMGYFQSKVRGYGSELYGPQIIHSLEYDKESDGFVIRVQFSYSQPDSPRFEEIIATRTVFTEEICHATPATRYALIQDLIIAAEVEAVTGHSQVKRNREKLVNAIIEYKKD